ncbi:bifunctional aminoglycoside phosphotransferase/ATP-binding protein [Sphingomonas sp. TDK1]|uniref:bifunctional aminoglycoside phosphotransferase/ATP-binding protein n=1 Tax=Sphingomonas sp. TDK1 TaxID=453247 RepID=UPI0007DA34B0|nr:bifunctional aminoglycoside phosphotransferase/ATP-binding protein [Sphingomonas sp. TDK1]OAN64940.1 hypothetical protein A7X12_16325 [Sphingomonas sp. TDK1]
MPASDDAYGRALDLLEAIARAGADFERIDTHAATILLHGKSAWKLKRPIRFGYLDFSTADRRHAAVQRELELNRRTAPGLYHGLRCVRRDEDGTLSLDGAGTAVEWLLEMERFPDRALLAHLADAGMLDDRLLTRLADTLHSFHEHAQIVPGGRGAERLARVVEGNAASIAACPEVLDTRQAQALIERQRSLIRRFAPLLDARAEAARVRVGHGDLHLANIALIAGEPVPFDCLEFDEALASIDVLYDLAFLLFDLWRRDLRHEANLVFNRYLDLSPADETGAALIPLFVSIRAAIRAHVAAATPCQAVEARNLLALAGAVLMPSCPVLLAIGGLSGTGKSSLARALGDLGGVPGARILRSDVLRKRLAGVQPETRLPPASYTPEASAAVYHALGKGVAGALAEERSVIADAVFAKEDERRAMAVLAERAGVPFRGIWLEAPETVRLARVDGRIGDASDAGRAVAAAQSGQTPDGVEGWTVLDAARPLAALLTDARALLR